MENFVQSSLPDDSEMGPRLSVKPPTARTDAVIPGKVLAPSDQPFSQSVQPSQKTLKNDHELRNDSSLANSLKTRTVVVSSSSSSGLQFAGLADLFSSLLTRDKSDNNSQQSEDLQEAVHLQRAATSSHQGTNCLEDYSPYYQRSISAGLWYESNLLTGPQKPTNLVDALRHYWSGCNTPSGGKIFHDFASCSAGHNTAETVICQCCCRPQQARFALHSNCLEASDFNPYIPGVHFFEQSQNNSSSSQFTPFFHPPTQYWLTQRYLENSKNTDFHCNPYIMTINHLDNHAQDGLNADLRTGPILPLHANRAYGGAALKKSDRNQASSNVEERFHQSNLIIGRKNNKKRKKNRKGKLGVVVTPTQTDVDQELIESSKDEKKNKNFVESNDPKDKVFCNAVINNFYGKTKKNGRSSDVSAKPEEKSKEKDKSAGNQKQETKTPTSEQQALQQLGTAYSNGQTKPQIIEKKVSYAAAASLGNGFIPNEFLSNIPVTLDPSVLTKANRTVVEIKNESRSIKGSSAESTESVLVQAKACADEDVKSSKQNSSASKKESFDVVASADAPRVELTSDLSCVRRSTSDKVIGKEESLKTVIDSSSPINATTCLVEKQVEGIMSDSRISVPSSSPLDSNTDDVSPCDAPKKLEEATSTESLLVCSSGSSSCSGDTGYSSRCSTPPMNVNTGNENRVQNGENGNNFENYVSSENNLLQMPEPKMYNKYHNRQRNMGNRYQGNEYNKNKNQGNNQHNGNMYNNYNRNGYYKGERKFKHNKSRFNFDNQFHHGEINRENLLNHPAHNGGDFLRQFHFNGNAESGYHPQIVNLPGHPLPDAAKFVHYPVTDSAIIAASGTFKPKTVDVAESDSKDDVSAKDPSPGSPPTSPFSMHFYNTAPPPTGQFLTSAPPRTEATKPPQQMRHNNRMPPFAPPFRIPKNANYFQPHHHNFNQGHYHYQQPNHFNNHRNHTHEHNQHHKYGHHHHSHPRFRKNVSTSINLRELPMNIKEFEVFENGGGKFDLSMPEVWKREPSQQEINQHTFNHKLECFAPPPELHTSSRESTENSYKLSCQVWNLFFRKQQKDSTLYKKHALRTKIYDALKDCGRNVKQLLLGGSSISGFGLDESDIDLCYRPTDSPNYYNSYIDYRRRAEKVLLGLEEDFKKLPWASEVLLINACVPILRLTDTDTKLQIDINVDSVVGIKNTYLMHAYAQCDWRVRPLVVCAKLWAASHDINSAQFSTISSYSLALMVIHYLQVKAFPPVLPILQKYLTGDFSNLRRGDSICMTQMVPKFVSNNTQDLGTLFLGFLEYFTNFNYEDSVMSVKYGRCGPRSGVPHAESDLIFIEEPFNFTNTTRAIAQKDKYDKILQVFKTSYETLKKTHNLKDIIPDVGDIADHIVKLQPPVDCCEEAEDCDGLSVIESTVEETEQSKGVASCLGPKDAPVIARDMSPLLLTCPPPVVGA